MTRKGLRAVLFDWDGNRVNSADKTYHCYVHVFASFGIGFDRALFERTYSPDWRQTYAAVGLPREQWPLPDERWIACYHATESALIAGTQEALAPIPARHLPHRIAPSGAG